MKSPTLEEFKELVELYLATHTEQEINSKFYGPRPQCPVEDAVTWAAWRFTNVSEGQSCALDSPYKYLIEGLKIRHGQTNT